MTANAPGPSVPYANTFHWATRTEQQRYTWNDPFQTDYEGPLEGYAWDALRTLSGATGIEWTQHGATSEPAEEGAAEVWSAARTLREFLDWLNEQVAEHGLPIGADDADTKREVLRWLAVHPDSTLAGTYRARLNELEARGEHARPQAPAYPHPDIQAKIAELKQQFAWARSPQ